MNRYHRFRRRSFVHSFFFRLLLLLFLSFFFIFLLLEIILRPIFLAAAETEALRLANQALYQVVEEEISHLDYGDLINYSENNQGEIVLFQVNHYQVSRFISKVTVRLQDRLDDISEKGMSLPLAQLLGIQVLAGFGPRLQVKILPLGVADSTSILDEFEAVGINQTRHRIYLQFNPRILIMVPFMEELVQVKARIPVTEVTIMGRVPTVYLNLEGGLFGVPFTE